jgi:thiol-disulfide isomerase/thioredoxin
MNSACRARPDLAVASIAAAMLMSVSSQLAVAQQQPRNFVTPETAKPIAALGFKDADGSARTLADFNGKVVLLNIWATWCIPCRKEMPALDRLQAHLGGPDLEVVPLSIDRGGIEVIRKFYDETGITHLAMYVDASGQAVQQLRVVGLPTTFLIDRAGLERGFVIGPAEWDSPEIADFLSGEIANTNARPKEVGQVAQDQPPPKHADEPGLLARGLRWLWGLVSQ